jgi:HSP20 family protein
MAAMMSWELFDDLRTAQDEMLWLSGRGNWRPGQQRDGATSTAAWAPAADITERSDAYLVAVEVPGVSAGDIQITIEDGLLTIQGERHRGAMEGAEQVHRSEQRHGAFRRSITLPSQVEADRIEASAQDGVLHILVPKPKETRAKRISVRPGERLGALTPSEAAARNGQPTT